MRPGRNSLGGPARPARGTADHTSDMLGSCYDTRAPAKIPSLSAETGKRALWSDSPAGAPFSLNGRFHNRILLDAGSILAYNTGVLTRHRISLSIYDRRLVWAGFG